MPLLRRDFLGLIWMVPAGAWCGCSRGGSGPAEQEYCVSAGPYLTMSSLYLARERGYFRQAGLPLKLLEMPSTNQVIPLMADGKIDIAFVAINAGLINAVVRGAPIRIVAGRNLTSPECPTTILYVNARAFPGGVADLRQLKGRRFAVRRSVSLGLFWLDMMLTSAGMTLDDVEVVRLRRPEAVAALTGGRVDAMLSSDLKLTRAAASREIIPSIPLARAAPNFQYSFIAFGPRLLRGDVDVGARFLSAYLRATREFIGGATPKFMDEYAARNGLDPEAVRTACRENTRADGEIQVQDVQRVIDWCVQRRLVEKALSAADLIDHRFLDRLRETAKAPQTAGRVFPGGGGESASRKNPE